MNAGSSSAMVPKTELPFYDLWSRGSGPGNTAESSSVQFHSVFLPAVPVSADRQEILKAFATFVAAVVEQDNVAFVAEYLSTTEGSEPQVERRLVTASALVTNKPHTFDSESTTLTIEESNATNEECLDFAIRLYAPHEVATKGQDGPLRQASFVPSRVRKRCACCQHSLTWPL